MRTHDVVLSDFEIIEPKHAVDQEDINDWILNRHMASLALESKTPPASYEKIFSRYAVKPALIGQRFFECADVLTPNLKNARVYPVGPNQASGADIGERTRFFAERASQVFNEFYENKKHAPDHLVHVTCTGYRSPSAAQLLVAGRGWGGTTGVTHAYHMGCYAALPAIRIAQGLVAAHARDSVDIVHTEMCGLHMNANAHTAEQIVVQTLFADGHAKYTVSQMSRQSHGLRLKAVKELVVADSHTDMSWAPEPWGLQMNLSREVPVKIRSTIQQFFIELAEQAHLNWTELLKNAVFAIHPGGPKIIDSVAQMLELHDRQVVYSREILHRRGNMSSATLPHIWNEILKSDAKRGSHVVSFAFGPGLTIFGSVFEVI